MRKIHLTILALVLFTVTLSAALRSTSEALQIGINHANNKSLSDARQKAPASKNLQLAYTLNENDIAKENGLVYVFNVGENNGFVVISGSDKANEILGYAHTGTFDANKIPDGLNYWLNGFAEEIKLLENAPETSSFEVHEPEEAIQKAQTASQFSSAISPLLGGMKWNQGEPYNNLSPIIPSTSQRSVTGCVATGMAQVMKYHQWPVNGTGSNSYTTETHKIPLNVNFSATTYDWANMTNTYNTSSTNEQKLAVATLMYHSGVATNMDFAASSGTTTSKMATALITHFGYDANLNLLKRDYYTRNEWINLLKTELNASRPVLYGGLSATAGHLFIFDGYDTNDFFHINWGWGGLSDGYYALTALNPSSQGIGGSSGGYNSHQDIVVGLQKPNPVTVPFYQIYMQEPISSSNQSVLRNGNTTISIKKTFNFGVNKFTGNIGLGLYLDNTLISVVKSLGVDLSPNFGFNSYDVTNVNIPAGVANGTYKLHTIYKANNETNWSRVRGYVGTPNFLYVQVSSNNVTYTNASDYGPNLSLNTLSATGNVYQDKTGRFVVQVTNTGQEYNSKLGVYLQLKSNSSVYQLITEDVNISTNETTTHYIKKTITLLPGEYSLAAMYDPSNVRATASSLSQLGNTQTINILPTPTTQPVFTLTSQISFPDNSKVNKENAILSANILNSGGFFEDNMIAFIFPSAGGTSLTYIGHQKAILDANEQRIISFSGGINLDPNQYLIVTYYWNGSVWTRLQPNENSAILFTLQSDFTAVEAIPGEIDQLQIYPNPADNYISFNTEKIVDEIYIYQIDGKLIKKLSPGINGSFRIDISDLNSGNYLLQVNATGNLQIGRFIKQ